MPQFHAITKSKNGASTIFCTGAASKHPDHPGLEQLIHKRRRQRHACAKGTIPAPKLHKIPHR